MFVALLITPCVVLRIRRVLSAHPLILLIVVTNFVSAVAVSFDRRPSTRSTASTQRTGSLPWNARAPPHRGQFCTFSFFVCCDDLCRVISESKSMRHTADGTGHSVRLRARKGGGAAGSTNDLFPRGTSRTSPFQGFARGNVTNGACSCDRYTLYGVYFICVLASL